MKTVSTLAVSLLLPASLLADFSYKETTRLTGGVVAQAARALGGLSKSMRKVGEPVTSTVLVKGNRMAHVNESSADIWDLDTETLTHVDFEKRTYSTITFAQMKEAMERAMAKAKQEQRKQAGSASDPQVDLNFKLDIQETGKTQTFDGLPTREVIMTVILEGKDKKSGQSGDIQTMNALWITDRVPGYEEVEQFHKRMAEKMASNWADSSMVKSSMSAMMDPRFREAAEKMAKEAEKLKGVQVRSVMKMGTNLDPRTASEVTDPSTMPEGPTAGDLAKRGAGSAIGSVRLPGGFGTLGGLGRKRKQDEAPAPSQPPAQQTSGVLMEMLTENSGFSTAPVDASKLSPPAGFRQVEHPMLRAAR